MALNFTAQGATDTKAAATMTAAIPAAAALYSYCTGLSITGLGATAGSGPLATLTGVIGGPYNIVVAVPAGITAGLVPIVMAFDPPLQSTAINTAITLSVPSFGAGNTVAACFIIGYQEG